MDEVELAGEASHSVRFCAQFGSCAVEGAVETVERMEQAGPTCVDGLCDVDEFPEDASEARNRRDAVFEVIDGGFVDV